MAKVNRFQDGKRLEDGAYLNTVLGKPRWHYQTGIVARAGGGQSNATALPENANIVATVATAADSVKLPPAEAGLVVFVKNGGANSMQVFGSGIDTINGVATATGVAQAAGLAALYVCTRGSDPNTAGQWDRILSA